MIHKQQTLDIPSKAHWEMESVKPLGFKDVILISTHINQGAENHE